MLVNSSDSYNITMQIKTMNDVIKALEFVSVTLAKNGKIELLEELDDVILTLRYERGDNV